MNDFKTAETKFQVLDHVPTGICIIREDYRVLFWNACLENWTGIPKHAIVGTDLAAHLPHLKEPKYYSRIKTITSGGPPAIFSSQLHAHLFSAHLTTGRSRIQHTTVSAVPAFDGGGFFALFAVEDVTELTSRIKGYRTMRDQAFAEVRQRKQTENELRKANRKIKEQQKAVIEEERLKVLLQMAGATAHELNQPLMALLGNLELFDLSKNDPEKAQKHLCKVREAGQRISETVKKIQTIRYDDVKPHDDRTTIINLDQKSKILAVEDSEEDYKRIKKILDEYSQLEISRSTTIENALKLLEKSTYDIILSDYLLQDGTAYDLLLKKEGLNIQTPLVVITGKGDEMLASQMLQAGAYDYLPKNHLSRTSLLRIIQNTLEKVRLKMEVRKAQAKMIEMTTVDELTQLYNRRHMQETLTVEFARAVRYHTDLVFVMLDLDHFKAVNDTYGHAQGDRVLSVFGEMLKQFSRKSDVACRYGGEEFSLILPSTSRENAHAVCEKIRTRVAERQFGSHSNPFHMTISIGVASVAEAQSVKQLIENADTALYKAKAAGRNRIVVYDKHSD